MPAAHLIGAAGDCYTAGVDPDCHRYDKQAATGLTDLLALARYAGDAKSVAGLAGALMTTPLLERIWSRQVEASIAVTTTAQGPATP